MAGVPLFHQWEEGALDWKAGVELGKGDMKGEGHCSSVSAFGCCRAKRGGCVRQLSSVGLVAVDLMGD